MSGLFTPRVNRAWARAQANITVAVWFWEWLKYFDAHLGFSFVGYGTGKVQSGTEPPSAWKDWNPASEAVPMGENSWFVAEASNADPQLDGGGGTPWQVKFQFALGSGFDDCNVADASFGFEGTTYVCCVRANAMGGWNATTLDFAPVSGEQSSDNYRACEGQDKDFYLDIIGDDDTIFWRTSVCLGIVNAPARSRGGYIGMLQRRSGAIANPFFMKLGRAYDGGVGSLENAINSKRVDNVYYEWGADGYWNRGQRWPTYSVWNDGTRVTTHHHDCWDIDSLPFLTIDPVSGEDVVPAMLVSQKQDPFYHAIIGEYRLIGSTFTRYGHGTVFGTDQDWIEICYQSTTYGGIAMRWPSGVVPVFV